MKAFKAAGLGRSLMVALALGVGSVGALSQFDAGPEPKREEFSQKIRDDVLATMESTLGRSAYVPGADFSKWPDMVAKHRSRINTSNNETEFVTAINSALHEFGFSHIVLYSPKFSEQRRTHKMVGLGVRIQLEPGGVRVTSLIKGAGAEAAGVQPGDLIVEADGKKISGPPDLTGDEGSKITITVKRNEKGKQKELKIEVVRKAFSTLIPESIEWPKKDVALIKIPSFDMGYDGTNVEKLVDEASKAKGVILDLRGNGGGQVSNLIQFSGYFLPAGEPFGTFVSRQLMEQYKKENPTIEASVKDVAAWAPSKLKPYNRSGKHIDAPVAVLIDGGTGSASEMMAASMRELRGSTLIGSKSAGAVLASIMMPIVHGYILQYPVTDYVTVKGYRIEGNGLVPDKTAPIPKFGEKDKAVQEALNWLKHAPKK